MGQSKACYEVPPGHRYFAVGGTFGAVRIAGPITQETSYGALVCIPAAILPVDTDWSAWDRRAYLESSLTLLLHSRGQMQDHEATIQGRQILEDLLWGMLLLGAQVSHKAWYSHGMVENCGRVTRWESTLFPPRYFPNSPHSGYCQSVISGTLVERAWRLAEAINGPLVRKAERFSRFNLGLSTLMAAYHYRYQRERLHQFTRAMEALLPDTRAFHGGTAIEKGLEAFFLDWEKGKTLHYDTIGGKVGLLKCLYELRNKIEHLRHLSVVLPGYDSQKDHVKLWPLLGKAELLATSLYVRILENPTLLKTFTNEAELEQFYARTPDERLVLWGKRIDLQGSLESRAAAFSE